MSRHSNSPESGVRSLESGANLRNRGVGRGLLLLNLLMIVAVMTAVPLDAAELMPPVLAGQERLCLDCHRRPNVNTNEGALASQAFCLECHSQSSCLRETAGRRVFLRVSPETFGQSRHRWIACVQCHPDVARSPHKSESGAQCLACHPVHGGGKEPHLRVECQACHRVTPFVTRSPATGRIVLSRFDPKNQPMALVDHGMADVQDRDFCQRCHIPGNQVGASARVLPEKGLLCLPCHEATLTPGHWLFWIALGIFLVGVFSSLRLWFKGRVFGEEKSLHRKVALTSEAIWQTVFSRKFWSILKTLILDILLQRRLLQESMKRWIIHSLIYFSILARFLLAVLALISYQIRPNGGATLALIDKNSAFTAAAGDFFGLLLLIGLVWAAVERFITRPKHAAREGQDTAALIILGLLVLSGFLVEGARLVMTQLPEFMAVHSFAGQLVARFLKLFSRDFTSVYPYLWYLHAVLMAILIAWLPFGKMRHILVTPLSLILSRETGHVDEPK